MAAKTAEQVARAYELSAFLQEHEDAHDQNTWLRPFTPTMDLIGMAQALNDCGTTACAAGWTCLLAGGLFVGGATLVRPDGSYAFAEEWAAELLGLTTKEAYRLFWGAETLAEVKDAIEDIYGPYAGRP